MGADQAAETEFGGASTVFLQKVTLKLADPTYLLSLLVINAPHLFSEGLSAKRMRLGRLYSRTFM